MCGYFCPVCLTNESCNSFTRRPELDIINLHSSMLTRDLVCTHTTSSWCQSHPTANTATKNLNDLLHTGLVFSVSFFTIYFILNFQLLHLHPHQFCPYISIFQKNKKAMLWWLLILCCHTTVFIPWPALHSIFMIFAL